MREAGGWWWAWRRAMRCSHFPCHVILIASLLVSSCLAQHDAPDRPQAAETVPQAPAPRPTPASSSGQQAGGQQARDRQIEVNWLYGAYVPRDVPLVALNGEQRVRLWVRATFTTYGIYAKTALFSVSDQVNDRPPAWGDGWAGYGKRVASRQGQFVIQNSLSALGNGIVGYEPRYNRCQCDGFWPRTGHAVTRNFITYDRSETKRRLQIPLYLAAFGAGVVAGLWTPNHDLLTTGAHGALSQAVFGVLANMVGEFWPQIERIWKHKKPASTAPAPDGGD